MNSDVIIRNFKRSNMERVLDMRKKGYSAENIGDAVGRNGETIRRYLRVFDIYGITAFAKD